MGTISSKTRSIEDDHKDIQVLFQAAKMGQWENVFRILGSPNQPFKPYLINLIPENRRWGIIQQAVWWNNQSVISKLLKFPTCDKDLKAKDGICERGHTGCNTASEIAAAFGYLQVKQILDNHINFPPDSEIDTFYNGTIAIENEEFGLFRLTLAAYKEAFHPSVIDKKKPLSHLSDEIYRHITTGENWLLVRDRLAQSLYCVCMEAGDWISLCTNRDDFFEQTIRIYTDEDTKLYTYVNTALRRQRDIGFKPTSTDLALGPYILMFHVLLYSWKILQHETKTTYRTMKVTPKDLQKYQPRLKFTWLSFVSSSLQKDYAHFFPSCEPSGNEEVLFIIDNSVTSSWQPLNIEAYAKYIEKERVYPAGAQFLVTRRTAMNGIPTVNFQLLAGEISGRSFIQRIQSLLQ